MAVAFIGDSSRARSKYYSTTVLSAASGEAGGSADGGAVAQAPSRNTANKTGPFFMAADGNRRAPPQNPVNPGLRVELRVVLGAARAPSLHGPAVAF
jgi:hypothetical protein